MKVDLRLGDCLPYMKKLADKSIACVLTDPPYGLGDRLSDGGGVNLKILLWRLCIELVIGMTKYLAKKYLMRYLE